MNICEAAAAVTMKLRGIINGIPRHWAALLILMLTSQAAFAGKTETKRVNVGDTFTVYTTYQSYTQSVLWTYDYTVVQPQTTIYSISTSVTFKALKPMESSPSVIQAVTYYHKSGYPTTLTFKDVDDFMIYISDNSTVRLSHSSYTLYPNDSFTLYATASDGYTGNYTWTTSNSNAAYVSGSGQSVTVRSGSGASGSATIRVTLDNGKYAECYVNILKIDPQSVTIPSSMAVYVGEDQSISATVTPSNASTTLTWYTTASDKATVSNGVVRGVDEGSAQIYCRTSNGLESNRCNVTVSYRRPTGIKVSPSDVTLNLRQSRQLSYSLIPSNARATVTWHSEDAGERVVKLSSTGFLTPVGPGTTKVYAQTDNGYKAWCDVKVLPDPDNITVPGKILLMYGDSRKIDVSVSPADAYVQLVWSSDNPSVVRVGQDDTIEAVGGGGANVTVTTHNGKTAKAYVEVPEPNHRMHVWLSDGSSVSFPMKSHPKVEFPGETVAISGQDIDAEFGKADFRKLTFSHEANAPMPVSIDMPESLDLTYGDRYQMPYTLQPDDYDFATHLEWSTTDSHVAVVSASGVVTAVGGGEADIICEASNGCRAVCHVIVPDPEFYFIVWLKDGRISSSHLREKPMVKYEDGVYTFVTASSETQYDAADVAKITLADNPEGIKTGIEDISADYADSRATYSFAADSMMISGGRPGSATEVFSVSGIHVASYKADAQGCTVIPLSELPDGVLIIKSEKITFKFIKK